MKSKVEILEEFELFSVPTGGIGNWLTEETHSAVFERIGTIDEEPLSAVQLNQLLGTFVEMESTVVDFVTVKAPKSHRDQQGSGHSR
jgi:hypothetical protein